MSEYQNDQFAKQSAKTLRQIARRQKKQKQAACQYCGSPVHPHIKIGCLNCWEVRCRLGTFLKSPINRDYVQIALAHAYSQRGVG